MVRRYRAPEVRARSGPDLVTWPLITFLALWVVGFGLLTFMAAAVPSTESASNSDVLVIAGITGATAAMLTLMAVGVASFF